MSAELCRTSMGKRITTRLAVLALTTLLIPISFSGARFPEEQLLQHVPTVAAVAGLTWISLRCGISSVSFYSLTTFLLVHIFGARWIYSFVPYDDWCQYFTGNRLSEQMGWERNQYDRLVHFLSGVLGVPPSSELLQRTTGIRPRSAAALAICVVMTVGAIYEVLEWQLAVWMSPAQAEAYNGQQGDPWDPQKDLALALIGSLCAAWMVRSWSPVIRRDGELPG